MSDRDRPRRSSGGLLAGGAPVLQDLDVGQVAGAFADSPRDEAGEERRPHRGPAPNARGYDGELEERRRAGSGTDAVAFTLRRREGRPGLRALDGLTCLPAEPQHQMAAVTTTMYFS